MNRKITRRLLVLFLLFTAHFSLPTAKALDAIAAHGGATNSSRGMPTREEIFNPVGHGGLRWTTLDVCTPIPDEVLNSPNPEPSRSASDLGSGALSDAPVSAPQTPAGPNNGGQAFNVKTYGAVGDAIEVTDAAITSGQSTLTSVGSSFPATVVGKSVSVRGAGEGGATLRASVIARPTATTLTLSVKASAT